MTSKVNVRITTARKPASNTGACMITQTFTYTVTIWLPVVVFGSLEAAGKNKSMK